MLTLSLQIIYNILYTGLLYLFLFELQFYCCYPICLAPTRHRFDNVVLIVIIHSLYLRNICINLRTEQVYYHLDLIHLLVAILFIWRKPSRIFGELKEIVMVSIESISVPRPMNQYSHGDYGLWGFNMKKRMEQTSHPCQSV